MYLLKISSILFTRLNEIGESTFQNCVKLDQIPLSTTIKNIGSTVFQYYTKLTLGSLRSFLRAIKLGKVSIINY